jgi:hypothetical protein
MQSSGFVFASPIVYIASVQLFSDYQQDDKKSNFTEFLFMVLQQLNSTTLQESLGKSTNDVLLEHSWQMEFYSCSQFLPWTTFSY